MSEPYAWVWAENAPANAVPARDWLHSEWLAFWIGLKTYWPDPRQAQRVCVAKNTGGSDNG